MLTVRQICDCFNVTLRSPAGVYPLVTQFPLYVSYNRVFVYSSGALNTTASLHISIPQCSCELLAVERIDKLIINNISGSHRTYYLHNDNDNMFGAFVFGERDKYSAPIRYVYSSYNECMCFCVLHNMRKNSYVKAWLKLSKSVLTKHTKLSKQYLIYLDKYIRSGDACTRNL